jgi:hypothetical protein
MTHNAKHQLRHMRVQGSGAIVNCSSIGGLIGLPGRPAYHASKHRVIGLTKSSALSEMPVKESEEMKAILRDRPLGGLGVRRKSLPQSCGYGVRASFVIGHALAADRGFTAH